MIVCRVAPLATRTVYLGPAVHSLQRAHGEEQSRGGKLQVSFCYVVDDKEEVISNLVNKKEK